MIRVLFRLSLLACIGYGGYLVYGLQRVARDLETVSRDVEASVNGLLLPHENEVSIMQISCDQHYSLWLFNAPPGKAVEVQLQYKSSDQISTETLMRIPSRTSSHYGTIELQFDSDTSPPMTRVRQLSVFGPDFRKAELLARDSLKFDDIRFANQVLPRQVLYVAKRSQGITRGGLRIQNGMVMKDEIQKSSMRSKTIGADQFVLCAFDEVEDTGKKITQVNKVIRVVVIDE